MITDEIERIHKNISAVYDGQPWHGDNILTQLKGISAEIAVKRPANLNHSIAEIICHMTAWRYFVIEKMKGNKTYEVWDTDLNWKNLSSLSEAEWHLIKDDLRKSQVELLQQIEKMPESLLTSLVDGRKYNFRLMLQGIVQHDIHHTGQMSIIRKLV